MPFHRCHAPGTNTGFALHGAPACKLWVMVNTAVFGSGGSASPKEIRRLIGTQAGALERCDPHSGDFRVYPVAPAAPATAKSTRSPMIMPAAARSPRIRRLLTATCTGTAFANT